MQLLVNLTNRGDVLSHQGRKKYHIVVVDDSSEFCSLLRDFLTATGYEVSVFVSAKTALERIDGAKHDLVICDRNMPEMNGMQLLKLSRNDHLIPFIMVTADGSPEVEKEARKNGASGFLQKPFPLGNLADLARKLLGK